MKKFYKMIDLLILWVTILLDVTAFFISMVFIIETAFGLGIDLNAEALITIFGTIYLIGMFYILMDKKLLLGAYLYDKYLNSSLWDKAYDLGVR